MKNKLFIAILLYLLQITMVEASDDDIADRVIRSRDEYPEIKELNWLNQNFLTKQRSLVEEIARSHFGKTLQSNKNDLTVLQRIVDEQLIKASETSSLQALGVVLGDAYVSDSRELAWKIFTDKLGPTHAVCVKGTKQCIFTLTMLSRRMEVGLKPNVERVYNQGLEAISPFLPKLPYSVKKQAN